MTPDRVLALLVELAHGVDGAHRGLAAVDDGKPAEGSLDGHTLGVPGRTPACKHVSGRAPRSGSGYPPFGGVRSASWAMVAAGQRGCAPPRRLGECRGSMAVRRTLLLCIARHAAARQRPPRPRCARTRCATARSRWAASTSSYPRGNVPRPERQRQHRAHARAPGRRARAPGDDPRRDAAPHRLPPDAAAPTSAAACTSRTAEPFYGTGEENQSLMPAARATATGCGRATAGAWPRC